MCTSKLRTLAIVNADKIRFIIVGLANTMTGLGVIFLLKFFFGMPDVPANLAGYSLGILQSFFLNKSWTFRFAGSTLSALPRFLLVVGIAYCGNLLTVLIAIVAGVDSYLAQTLGVLPYTAFGYLGSKYFAFSAQQRKTRN